MNTKSIGNIGEAVAIAEFAKRNIPISIPFGDNQKYDLIIEINNELKKVQVKTSEYIHYKKEKIDFFISLVKSNTKGCETTSYKSTDFDYFYLYCIENDMSFLVENVKSTPKGSITIRLKKSNNGQSKNINMFYDFEFNTVINNLLINK